MVACCLFLQAGTLRSPSRELEPWEGSGVDSGRQVETQYLTYPEWTVHCARCAVAAGPSGSSGLRIPACASNQPCPFFQFLHQSFSLMFTSRKAQHPPSGSPSAPVSVYAALPLSTSSSRCCYCIIWLVDALGCQFEDAHTLPAGSTESTESTGNSGSTRCTPPSRLEHPLLG